MSIAEHTTADPKLLKAPFPYFGGKSKVAADVWARLGDVPNYVEPFFGSGAVLLARPHSPRTETVNDADGHLANFWRAVQADPDAVAYHADWPVSELDLHARHLWLVNEGRRRVERLRIDPEYYDAQSAGWWVWGICQWIGSGWCSGKGPLKLGASDGELNGDDGRGVHKQRPHLGDDGMGVHKKLPHLGNDGRGAGVKQQIPHLGTDGQGVHLARPGGVSQQLPAIVIGGGAGVHGFRFGGTCEERSETLRAYMRALRDRLRRVRVSCGDWSRVTGPSVTTKHGLTGVFLDPPYSHAERHDETYAVDTDCGADVREWAIANGDNPLLRIALCGYEGEHVMPDTWECFRWKAAGGYGSQGEGRGRENAARECIWFSPHCLDPRRKPDQLGLDLLAEGSDSGEWIA